MDAQVFLPSSQIPILYMPHLRLYGISDVYLFCNGLLDEPFNGLDNQGVNEMRALFLELKKQGKVTLLASHNAEDIRILCDRVYSMEAGRLTAL